MDVEGGHDVPVDLAHEDHAGDVEGLGVGHPQAVDELGDLAQPAHHVADLGAAAVDDHEPEADGVEEGDVLGEGGQPGVGLVPSPAGHEGAAAVLHHHHRVPEAPDVGQGLDQDGGLVAGVARWRAPSRRAHVLVDVGVGEVVGEDRGRGRRRGPRSAVRTRFRRAITRPRAVASCTAATPWRQTVMPP